MSRLLPVAALLACALGAAPAFAAEAQGDLICRYEQDTGSHLKKRVCTTRAQREDQQKQARDKMDRATGQQNAQAQMQRASAGGASR